MGTGLCLTINSIFLVLFSLRDGQFVTFIRPVRYQVRKQPRVVVFNECNQFTCCTDTDYGRISMQAMVRMKKIINIIHLIT